MKIVFLDVDGVLNCMGSKSKCKGLIGIDDKRVKLLKQIVDVTNAFIVLTSSWKTGWKREPIDKDSQKEMGNYLDRKLKKERLYILDKTKYMSERGKGIIEWIDSHNVDTWCVLDDEIFSDYEEYGILPHLVKTSFYDLTGGLQQIHVDKAVDILIRRGIWTL